MGVNYLKDWVNWIELTLFTTSIIFVVIFFTDCLCPMGWQWQLGAMAVFLGWLDLILFLRKLLPLTGIYIVMFVDIFYTFCRLFVFALLLVIAFGLSFYMAFNEPHLKRTPFSTTARTLLNIMTMTTGEFDYSGIFRLAPMGTHETFEEIPFPPVSYILWIAFIIIMPILLTNLLVGLAVDNIKGTLDDAVLKRRALQVELVLTVEEVLPVYLRRYFITGSREIHPNRSLSLWEKCKNAWGREQKDSSENISKALNPPLTPIEQVQSQTRRLLREVDDMRQRNQRLENMLSAIVQHHNITVDDERKHFAQPSMVYRERISLTS
jgi:transient receptor potential cation channel subfamily A protein 1